MSFGKKGGAQRAGKILIGAVLVLFLVLGILPLGHDALVMLERRYPPFDAQKAGPVAGIILLGGAVETSGVVLDHIPQSNDNADRIVEFIRLARLYPQARLLFTGGTAQILGRGPSEADLIAPMFEILGLEGRQILYEKRSRNTYENALFSKDLVKPAPGERWILVTSAFHMPRSVAVFESAGWPVIPAPSDFKTDGALIVFPRDFDVLASMRESEIALKEIIGFGAYLASGKISFPAPKS